MSLKGSRNKEGYKHVTHTHTHETTTKKNPTHKTVQWQSCRRNQNHATPETWTRPELLYNDKATQTK